ncbi:MAG TPA: serine hydrolase [Bacteroidia bacterium]|nr:serine hydrolase [Bacteroidia bacterium]
MKVLKFLLKAIAAIVLMLVVFILVSGKTYLFKTLAYNFVGIDDLDLFEHRTVATGEGIEWPLSKNYNNKPMPAELKSTLEQYKTVSFLVIKNDSILYEQYWEDKSDTSHTNSFSMAKSIIGVLIGIAIDEGKIKSLDQKVGDFIPEYKTGSRAQLTIRHLITMSAALSWDEAYANPLSVTTEAYYGTDLFSLVKDQEVVGISGKEFNYQSGCSQLLGFIIEKATGKHIAEYASEKLWKPLNAMHAAEWSLDKKDGTEKAYCCFYSNARDFARIGSLYLHHGNWHGNQILDSTYVVESVTPAPLDDNGQPNKVYGYHWWIGDYAGKHIFYCRGILGQYIVAIPDENIIFVRLGHKRGEKAADGSLLDMPVYVKGVMDWVKN